MAIPLETDFAQTLELIRRLRPQISKDPIVPDHQGEPQTHPAYKLLADQEKHLRGLARLIGPAKVEPQMASEFRAATKLVRKLMEMVIEEPTVVGRHAVFTKNPVATIMGQEQTHVRGCAAILQNSKSTVAPEDGEGYDDLFKEPTQLRAVGE